MNYFSEHLDNTFPEVLFEKIHNFFLNSLVRASLKIAVFKGHNLNLYLQEKLSFVKLLYYYQLNARFTR